MEQAHLTRFVVDVELEYDTKAASQDDDLALSIDYGEVFACLRDYFAGESVQLLETLANRAADILLVRFPELAGVTLRVSKPNPPVGGKVTAAWVEIRR